MTLAARRELAEVINEAGLTTVEDACSADLTLTGAAVAPTLARLVDPELLVAIGSASKLFWGGLPDRVDPCERRSRPRPCRFRSPWTWPRRWSTSCSPWTSSLRQPSRVPSRRAMLGEALAGSQAVLAEIVPTWAWQPIAGGSGLWMDTGQDAVALVERGKRVGVKLAAGPGFSTSAATAPTCGCRSGTTATSCAPPWPPSSRRPSPTRVDRGGPSAPERQSFASVCARRARGARRVDRRAGQGGAREGADPRADLGSREDFARALTRLREERGLTVREVAAAADTPVGTVGGYLSGRHLPPLAAMDQLLRVLRVLGVPQSEIGSWVDAVHRLRRAPGRRPSGSPHRTGAWRPRAGGRGAFVGRERVTQSLVARVMAGPGGPVVVVGACRVREVLAAAGGSGGCAAERPARGEPGHTHHPRRGASEPSGRRGAGGGPARRGVRPDRGGRGASFRRRSCPRPRTAGSWSSSRCAPSFFDRALEVDPLPEWLAGAAWSVRCSTDEASAG